MDASPRANRVCVWSTHTFVLKSRKERDCRRFIEWTTCRGSDGRQMDWKQPRLLAALSHGLIHLLPRLQSKSNPKRSKSFNRLRSASSRFALVISPMEHSHGEPL